MTSRIVYNFIEIERLVSRIDQVQKEMDETINAMKSDAERELAGFVGKARGQYDNFVVAFEQEKVRLFKLLDDTQEESRNHVRKVQEEEERYREAFLRTTNQVGLG